MGAFPNSTENKLRSLYHMSVQRYVNSKAGMKTFATVDTGLISVTPEDWTPTNENMKPRTRARMASPTFMENFVARIAQHITVLRRRPMDHQANGIRSSMGVW